MVSSPDKDVLLVSLSERAAFSSARIKFANSAVSIVTLTSIALIVFTRFIANGICVKH